MPRRLFITVLLFASLTTLNAAETIRVLIWDEQQRPKLLEDYRCVFAHAKNYKGTTRNLSMIHTLALLLADHIRGAENLPKDGNYGPCGDKAIKWPTERVERTAMRGSGEFASRPYMNYNVGTLLMLDNNFVPAELRKRAAISDGKEKRVYDVTKWTITETSGPAA